MTATTKKVPLFVPLWQCSACAWCLCHVRDDDITGHREVHVPLPSERLARIAQSTLAADCRAVPGNDTRVYVENHGAQLHMCVCMHADLTTLTSFKCAACSRPVRRGICGRRRGSCWTIWRCVWRQCASLMWSTSELVFVRSCSYVKQRQHACAPLPWHDYVASTRTAACYH